MNFCSLKHCGWVWKCLNSKRSEWHASAGFLIQSKSFNKTRKYDPKMHPELLAAKSWTQNHHPLPGSYDDHCFASLVRTFRSKDSTSASSTRASVMLMICMILKRFLRNREHLKIVNTWKSWTLESDLSVKTFGAKFSAAEQFALLAETQQSHI